MNRSQKLLILCLGLGASAQVLALDVIASHPRWCLLSANRETGPYINAAAGYVDMDPVLLAVGLTSEGLSKKTNDCDYAKKMATVKDIEQQSFIEQVPKLCAKDKFKTFNIYDMKTGQTKASPAEWKSANKYAPANAKYTAVATNGFTELLTGRQVVERTYYGDSHNDDGSDTFGLEYPKLREKGYLPKKFSGSNDTAVDGKSFEAMPNFVFLTNKTDRNENAVNRFISQDGDYASRIGRQSPPIGDMGRAKYKDAESQVFANAALWKLSSDKFYSAKKELINKYSKVRSPENDAIVATLKRPMTPTENAFWVKSFYNGGQGTQAGAWDMLNQFATKQWLKDTKYLTQDPGVSLKQIYVNARILTDSYTDIIKTTECTDTLKARAGKIKKEDYDDLAETTPSTSTNGQSGVTTEH